MVLRFKGGSNAFKVKRARPKVRVAGKFSGHEEDCHVCHGTGKDHGKTCGHCHGTGHEPDDHH